MKKTIVNLIVILMAVTFSNAQKIEMKKAFIGYKYIQNGKQLNLADLATIMKSNATASKTIKKARTTSFFTSVLSFTGGGLIGWTIGSSLGGKDPNWTLAGIGAGMITIAIPIASRADKKVKHAVTLYNSSLAPTSFQEFKPEFKIITNRNGIGLSIGL